MAAVVRRAWGALRKLPWRRFVAGAVSGLCGLLLTFILRWYGLGVFLPEVAMDFAVGHIPGEVESGFIRAFGEGAKLLGLTVAVLVFLAIPGVYAMFFRRVQAWIPYRWGVIAAYTVGPAAIALLVILPLIGGGFAGSNTFQGPWAAAFGQLMGSWLYAAALDYFLVDFAGKHPTGFDLSRRQFLKFAGFAAVGAVIALYGLSRLAPRLARLAFASVADLFAREVTPNEDFYVVTKNVIDPTVDAASWRLEVDGLVAVPATYTIEQLRDAASAEEHVTLECVSNEVGGNLISTAKWRGLPLRDVLDQSGVDPRADWVVFTCADGYTVAVPLAKARHPATLLALWMKDAFLPVKHGFPARIIVPGLYGMFHAKWLTRVTLVQGEVLGFWQQKGWTNRGAIRTTAIIATPSADTVVRGSTTIGGVAFAGDRGISRVEVSTDGGATWASAALKAPLSTLTWTLWTFPWTPYRSGSYRIVARAVDGAETAQERSPSPPFPNGASGYDAITLLVS